MDEKTYLTIRELCTRWKVNRNTLWNYRQKGIGPAPVQLLPGIHGLRYKLAEVVAYEKERDRARGLATGGT
jgi:hypothetical protein